MEQEPGSPCRSRKVWLGAILVVFLLWLAAPTRPGAPAMGVGLSPRQSGHMGKFYSQDFVVVFVTNATTRSIDLGNPGLQWEDGDDISAGANLWGGTNESCSVGPGQVMPLPIRVPPTSRKFKISFGYIRDAGRLQKVFSHFFGRFLSRLIRSNQPLFWRLIERGWLNGHLWLHYEGEWEINK